MVLEHGTSGGVVPVMCGGVNACTAKIKIDYIINILFLSVTDS